MARIIGDGEPLNMVGPKIRQARMRKGMSQQRLSDKLETMAIYVCRGSVSRVEEGKRTVTDRELYGFAVILDLDANELLELK